MNFYFPSICSSRHQARQKCTMRRLRYSIIIISPPPLLTKPLSHLQEKRHSDGQHTCQAKRHWCLERRCARRRLLRGARARRAGRAAASTAARASASAVAACRTTCAVSGTPAWGEVGRGIRGHTLVILKGAGGVGGGAERGNVSGLL
jgi:hypothetical protein